MSEFPIVQPAKLTQIQQRVRQQNVLPTAVKSRNLGSIIFGSDVAIAQTTLGNGNQAVISWTLTQNDKFELIGLDYITVYVGSVATTNILPGGSAIDETQWQVIGPFYDWENWSETNNQNDTFAGYQDFVTLYILNISAGSQDLIIYNKWKYVSPRENL